MPNFRWLFLVLMLIVLPGCYHMRTEAEPISPRVIALPQPPREVVRRIRVLVEDEWKNRILEADETGTILITAPYHFSTDTSFGQPAGGRKYYTQLRIEIMAKDNGSSVQISQHNFEIRTSYAYNNYGRMGEVGTMYKHYPYEEYPGMFDLNLINREMDRISTDIKRLFQEYR